MLDHTAPSGQCLPMSRQLINEYRADLDQLKMVSGSRRESALREAFRTLTFEPEQLKNIVAVEPFNRVNGNLSQ